MHPWVLFSLLIHAMSWVIRTSPAQGESTLCSARGVCYTLHATRLSYKNAKKACEPGVLTSMSEEAEKQNLLRLLVEALRGGQANLGKVWIGLSKPSAQCVLKDKTLRGFQWESGNDTSEVELWATEPVATCTSALCVALQSSGNSLLSDAWKWTASTCNHRNAHICRHDHEGVCQAPGVAHATVVQNWILYQPGNESTVFSPPGTEVTAMCHSGERNVTLTCLLQDGLYQWGSTAGLDTLCPCPTGYAKGEKEACEDHESPMAGEDHVSPSEGAEPGTDPTPYMDELIPRTRALTNGTLTTPPPARSTFPYLLVPITIGTVAMGVLILFVIAIFKFCFRTSGRAGSKTLAPATEDMDSAENGETGSAHSDREGNEMSTLPAGARPGSQGL